MTVLVSEIYRNGSPHPPGVGDAVAASLNREVLGDDARHFGGTVIFDGQLDADLLHLLHQELGGGTATRSLPR